MTPIEFPQQNVVYAKNQPQYLPLPAYSAPDGQVISCWQLSWREAIRLLVTRRLWLRQLTYGLPLQPQCPQVETPFETPTV